MRCTGGLKSGKGGATTGANDVEEMQSSEKTLTELTLWMEKGAVEQITNGLKITLKNE